jgi:hypothetical protein
MFGENGCMAKLAEYSIGAMDNGNSIQFEEVSVDGKLEEVCWVVGGPVSKHLPGLCQETAPIG